MHEFAGLVKGTWVTSQTVNNVDALLAFLNNVNEIPEKVAQLLEDESFPVDYTQALAFQDDTMIERWGVTEQILWTGVPLEEIGVYLACPAELGVYDSSGNVTGVVEGEIRMEIPNSFYYGNRVTIFLPNDTYTIRIVGTDTGTYKLEAFYMGEENITSFAAIDLPTSSNVTHQYSVDWDALSQGEDAVTVKMDSDGDGIFERALTSDGELRYTEFMGYVVDLNDDGKVNIIDVAIAAKAYGTQLGEENWNEMADINKDEIVNIIDISIVAIDFRKTV